MQENCIHGLAFMQADNRTKKITFAAGFEVVFN